MNITSFLIYCIIVTVTPGPTNIIILSTVNNWGTRKAMEYTYGATIAFGLLLVISAILNTALMAILPKILFIMQIIGSFYILYLAYQICKMDTSKSTAKETATFLSGFLMQFVNPKVVLFTMTVIPSFVMPYYTELSTLMIFVAYITIIGFIAFITWVLFGTIFKAFLQKHQKIVNIIMALFLVYSAIIVSGVGELIKG
ncbi:LysE family transporter [Clostridium beijerinckii]|uniref:Threonine/homoserine/homoserine lactone efflux protein n=1 Tax=Clostridium beijerinckii TaxID=1520 RepID=A0AAX0AUU3_CLOBE|nr:LysE family transporter [Clostridium beijerinckii]NOW05047.1 threonine/homoserine/homoserine lactone efflux protein [Clostridium beijerinckii]NRT36079.1 threonine/homoserine/homoserine lactone efflux protein [Clostridium beijerinckii]NRT44494.1 threonine/homoserine/homoserine lactone efflux protein [Clostridium beijerinckii]NRT72720.1 threonine/homoserine/homoserine lactone efflux protein [Clostridium beijerinckii]NRT86517.1 threonine/homoserine/homoserine lactone efflux protein [Clostridiu